ncbi:MAG: hypothetical protein ACLT8E_06615 [Akkermansia sp.]
MSLTPRQTMFILFMFFFMGWYLKCLMEMARISVPCKKGQLLRTVYREKAAG